MCPNKGENNIRFRAQADPQIPVSRAFTGLPAPGDRKGRTGAFSALAVANSVGRSVLLRHQKHTRSQRLVSRPPGRLNMPVNYLSTSESRYWKRSARSVFRLQAAWLLPACGARRMAETTAHLVDSVIPRVLVLPGSALISDATALSVRCPSPATRAGLADHPPGDVDYKRDSNAPKPTPVPSPSSSALDWPTISTSICIAWCLSHHFGRAGIRRRARPHCGAAPGLTHTHQ